MLDSKSRPACPLDKMWLCCCGTPPWPRPLDVSIRTYECPIAMFNDLKDPMSHYYTITTRRINFLVNCETVLANAHLVKATNRFDSRIRLWADYLELDADKIDTFDAEAYAARLRALIS